jgi:phytoene/squalene synthetase
LMICSTWPANDALCAALQIINHLQDCAADYRNLDRVYIPQDAFARHGTSVEALGEPKASPELRSCLRDVAERTAVLLHEADPFSVAINDVRLGLEVAVIHRVAQTLTRTLMQRDPLSERVHHKRPGFAALGLLAIAEELGRRTARLFGGGRQKPQDA